MVVSSCYTYLVATVSYRPLVSSQRPCLYSRPPGHPTGTLGSKVEGGLEVES